MNFLSSFIHHPVMTTFITLVIIFGGIFSYLHLPVTDLPSIEKPYIDITTSYKGASALTVLNQVTTPLEKELIQVNGVQEISSESASGYSEISLMFDLNKDMSLAVRDLQAAIQRADTRLPKELDQKPSYFLREDGKESILYILFHGENVQKKELEAYAEKYLIPQFSRIEGVSKVKTFGMGGSLFLNLDPDLMAARKVTFNQVADTLKHHLSQKPLGSIHSKNKTLILEMPGEKDDEEHLNQLTISGTQVKVKDIGYITSESKEVKDVYFVDKGKQSSVVLLGIQKLNGANTVKIAKTVEEKLASLNKSLPSTYQLNLWFNKSVWIEHSIQEVQWTLLIALFLVVLVIYFSLGRWIEAFIPSIALPLSLLGTLIVMYLANFSLDLLSLLALTLSVGFVIDDAIVVLENIVRHHEKGSPPLKAALNGSKQIRFTVLSMTLSLVAVFIPLLFMGGVNGRLFREFSATLSIAILLSGFISLSLIPLLSSRLLSHSKATVLEKKIFSLEDKAKRTYQTLLSHCLKHPLSLSLFTIAMGGAAFFSFSKLPVQFIPDEERGFISAVVHLPSGLDPEDFHTYQEKLNHLASMTFGVDSFLSLPYEDKLLLFIRIDHSKHLQAKIIQDLQHAFDSTAGIQAFLQGYQMIRLDHHFGHGGRFLYNLQGNSFEEVEAAADLLVKALREYPEFTSVKLSQSSNALKLTIDVQKDLADRFGLNKQDVQEVLGSSFGKNTFKVNTRPSTQENLLVQMEEDSLEKVMLKTKKGGFIPLKSIAEWKETMGPSALHHDELFPSSLLRFSLKTGVPFSEGIKKMEEVAASILPDGLKGEFKGAAKMIASGQKEAALLLLMAALVMYVVLGILYESFIHPLTILSSLPFAGLGGVLTLFLFQESLSLFSAVGFLLLIGIVKKNGIMMVDYALEMQKSGYNPKEAICEGCLVRFRPIMMTTFAAIMGALPLAIGFGQGGAPLRGLGLVIVGGLIFSQGFTLFVTPIIYLFFENMRRKTKQLASRFV